jgi:NTP pyrophosphatase (non-canonical NTP hydrolase)
MDKLDFNSYQEKAVDTAIYPGIGTLNGLMYTALGLGEVGELQGKVKKLYRDGGYDDPAKKEAIADELGDVLWYIANTAAELGYPLDIIASRNIAKLQSRKERGVLSGSGDNR